MDYKPVCVGFWLMQPSQRNFQWRRLLFAVLGMFTLSIGIPGIAQGGLIKFLASDSYDDLFASSSTVEPLESSSSHQRIQGYGTSRAPSQEDEPDLPAVERFRPIRAEPCALISLCKYFCIPSSCKRTEVLKVLRCCPRSLKEANLQSLIRLYIQNGGLLFDKAPLYDCIATSENWEVGKSLLERYKRVREPPCTSS